MGNFNNENLIPFTGELKPGQRLLKRPDGYFLPVGVSGGSNAVAGYFADLDGNGLKFYPTDSNNGESVNQIMIADTGENEPQYEGGNSMDFYKCASVDTTNKTWTGYKAIQNTLTGIYSFEENVTSGLIYNLIKPKPGQIYSDNVLININSLYTGIPSDYIIYHPLSSNISTVNGYSCNYNNVSFEQDLDLKETVAVFNENGLITISNISAYTSIAFSIFQKIEQNTGSGQQVVLREGFGILSTPSDAGVFSYNGGLELSYQFNNVGWHHIYCDYENSVTRLFIDGTLMATNNSYSYQYNSGFNSSSNIQMGVHFNGSSFPLIGRLKAFRMYNRKLNDIEIAALSNEFTSTQS